jgi:hypothetical protein
MSFERPAPDLTKIVAAWESWEKGEESPGRVMADMKTAGLATILEQLVTEGFTPAS